jgi:hypothetical protein
VCLTGKTRFSEFVNTPGWYALSLSVSMSSCAFYSPSFCISVLLCVLLPFLLYQCPPLRFAPLPSVSMSSSAFCSPSFLPLTGTCTRYSVFKQSQPRNIITNHAFEVIRFYRFCDVGNELLECVTLEYSLKKKLIHLGLRTAVG